jgi:hypothetical protein
MNSISSFATELLAPLVTVVRKLRYDSPLLEITLTTYAACALYGVLYLCMWTMTYFTLRRDRLRELCEQQLFVRLSRPESNQRTLDGSLIRAQLAQILESDTELRAIFRHWEIMFTLTNTCAPVVAEWLHCNLSAASTAAPTAGPGAEY